MTPGDPELPPPTEEAAETPEEGDQPLIDVRGMLRQASRRVAVDQLVKKGKKYIAMLSKQKIDELINQAVRTIIQKYRGKAPEGSDLEAEAKQDFNELLSQYQDASKARHDLESGREGLMGELGEMRKELETQKRISEGRMDEEAEQMLIIGFKEFEHELDRIVRKVFDRRKLILENEDSPEAVEELAQIERKLSIMIKKLVTIERERFAGRFAQDRYVGLLERRIGKLMEQMGTMENALKLISNQKLFSNQQIQNLLRELGLSEEDQLAKKKKEMLKVVFDQNVELRKQIAELRRQPGAA